MLKLALTIEGSVTSIESVSWQPVKSVTVTKYNPAVIFDKVSVVAPVFH